MDKDNGDKNEQFEQERARKTRLERLRNRALNTRLLRFRRRKKSKKRKKEFSMQSYLFILGFAVLNDFLDYLVIGSIPILGDFIDIVTSIILWLWIKWTGARRNPTALIIAATIVELIPFGDLVPSYTIAVVSVIIKEYYSKKIRKKT